jgi:hypothetical protein
MTIDIILFIITNNILVHLYHLEIVSVYYNNVYGRRK